MKEKNACLFCPINSAPIRIPGRLTEALEFQRGRAHFNKVHFNVIQGGPAECWA